MLRVGLTGGIGSGKTAAASHFSTLGIEVIDADEIVHKISTPGHQAYDAIVHHFGSKILNIDNSINRKMLRDIAFNNAHERKILEGILHPEVRLFMHQAVNELKGPYCILVIPLLVETGFDELVDRVLVISADITRRRKWIRQRSGLSDDQIEAIMASQASDEERRKIADDIIENSGTLESLYNQVEELDRKYRKL